MEVINKITVDLVRPGVKPMINVMQGDENARVLEVTINANGIAWEIPAGVNFSMAYKKPDGTKGLYDTLPDGSSASSVAENVVSIRLAPQMLTVPGTVTASVVISVDDQRVSTFPVIVNVIQNPAAGAVGSEDYFYGSVIGNLDDLKTTDKSSVVAAINEIFSTGGGSGYVLPIAGENLGGVKNGGNVVINADGTMDVPGSGQNPTGATVEPAEDDMPKVFITGVKPTTKDDVLAEMQYISKTNSFHAYLTIKCQGTSSMSYAKKNFTVKMFSDEARETKLKKRFKDWNHNGNKYVLKANFIDHSHARNIVSARLWNEVVKSRPDYDALPAEMRTSPRNGAVDGFPVKVYYNGTYEGIYTWNIGKDDWMWNMDEDNPNHVLLCAETNTDGNYRATPCNFRALWSGVDETDWSVEVGTNSPELKTSLNNLIQFVMDNDGENFRNGIGNHLDIQSAIDYYIFQYEVCGLDGLAKNMLLATYDGTLWRCGAYDLDSTFGLWWNGTKFVSATYACPEDYQEEFSLLWERIEANYRSELKTRQAELRKTVLSYSNIVTHFERFMDVIGLDLYAEDLTIYSAIPLGSTNNIKQIRNFVRDRQVYVDAEFAAMSDPVPCTGISLDKSTLTFTAEGSQTLIATVTPDGCTDPITWESDNPDVATVKNGVVTAVANGSATITVKCGEYSVICIVAVSGIETGDNNPDAPADYVYALSEARTFSGSNQDCVDTNTKLFDESKDFAIVIEFEGASDTVNNSAVFHCVNEASPWPGVSIDITSAHGYRVYANGGHLNVSLGDTRKQKYVIQKDSTANVLTLYKTFENTILQKDTSLINATFDLDIMLGIKQGTSGVPINGTQWKGTIHDFRVYFRKLTDTEIINELGDERMDLISSNNIAWTATADYGFNDGEQVDGDGYVTTDFIPVTAGWSYTLKNVDGGSFTWLEMYWYDSNYAYLGNNAIAADTQYKPDNKSSQTTSDAPSKAAYAKLKIFPNNNAENTPDKVIFY